MKNLFGEKGMIKQGNEDLHEVITSLKQKYDSPGADVSFELTPSV